MTYANHEGLDKLIADAVQSIEGGAPKADLTAMIKNSPTGILLADASHVEARYRPGSRLVTYNGVDKDGNPIQETYGGGVAEIKADSVILKNVKPITYPEGHKLAGQPAKGSYNADGTFVVDENGSTVLFNEYVSDTGFVKGAYGTEATVKWQSALKLLTSYAMQIPTDMGKVAITTKSGVEISLAGGDYVIIDTKKCKVTSVHGIESSWLDKTYVKYDDYSKSQKV